MNLVRRFRGRSATASRSPSPPASIASTFPTRSPSVWCRSPSARTCSRRAATGDCRATTRSSIGGWRRWARPRSTSSSFGLRQCRAALDGLGLDRRDPRWRPAGGLTGRPSRSGPGRCLERWVSRAEAAQHRDLRRAAERRRALFARANSRLPPQDRQSPGAVRLRELRHLRPGLPERRQLHPALARGRDSGRQGRPVGAEWHGARASP